MSASKRVTIVGGVGAFLVLAVVGLNWRQVYYWFVPEARFWGRWRPIAADGTTEVIGGRSLTWDFRRDGKLAFAVSYSAPEPSLKGTGSLAEQAKELARSSLMRPRVPDYLRYQVARDRITLSHDQPGEIGTVVIASYLFQFQSDNVLMMRREDEVVTDGDSRVLHDSEPALFRRLPEAGDR